MSALLQPTTLGITLPLRNRISMSSMTRNRNLPTLVPGPASVEYYTQRASAGFIISEGILISPYGTPWPFAPLMCEERHADAWKEVVDAVHAEGGVMVMQAWHAGKNEGMGIGEVREAVGLFRRAAELAKRAGFDGVEVLGQGGFLVHSFLCSSVNNRVDEYGGSVENRCRFALEVVDTVASIYGHDRVGIKLCPTDFYNGTAITHEEMTEVYTYLTKQLVARKTGYITLSRRGVDLGRPESNRDAPGPLRLADGLVRPGYEPLLEFGPQVKFPGSQTALMANEEYTISEAEKLVSGGLIALVSLGRPFIYNPDLIRRIENGVPLARNDRGKSVHYGRPGEPRLHFTDWPTAKLGEQVAWFPLGDGGPEERPRASLMAGVETR